MSSADFEAELRQSVQDSLALIRTAAKSAKARIGESPAPFDAPSFARQPAFDDDGFSAAAFSDRPYETAPPRPAVDFSLAEPDSFDVPPGEHDPGPDQAIAFDDFGGSVDDDGIPVWEDPP